MISDAGWGCPAYGCGSTVWTETFISDKAALTEVMSVIEEEGIETFMVEEKRTLH